MIELPDVMIDFDEEKHLYTLRGYRLPSVTQLMKPMSCMVYGDVSDGVLMEAADRGTRAHESISNIVLYGIEESDEDTEPYVSAFNDFMRDFKPTWVASEYRTYHKAMRYAGTIDLIGFATPDDGTGVDVCDIKTTNQLHRTMLSCQLGAYAEALKSHGIQVRNLYGLQLLRTGKYQFEKIDNGFMTFMHSMAIVKAMEQDIR